MIVSTIRQFGLRLRADPEEIPFQYSANVQMKFEKDENYNDYTVVGYYIPPGESEAKLLSINDDGTFTLGPDCFKQRGTLSFSFNLINSQEEVHLGSIDFEIRYAFGDGDTILPEPEEVWISLVTKVAKDAIKDDVAVVQQKAKEALQSASLANDKANEAQEYANNANQSANSASLSASSALTAKNDAIAASNSAIQAKQDAEQSANNAKNSANTALENANKSTEAIETVTQIKTEIENKANDFDTNYQEKLKSFNDNATSKQNAFDNSVQTANTNFDNKVTQANSDLDAKVQEATKQAQKAKEEADRATQATDGKLDKNLGVENAGKSLVVGENGEVVCGESGINEDEVNKIIDKAIDEKLYTQEEVDYLLADKMDKPYVPIEITDNATIDDALAGNFKIDKIKGNTYQNVEENIVPTPQRPVPINSRKVLANGEYVELRSLKESNNLFDNRLFALLNPDYFSLNDDGTGIKIIREEDRNIEDIQYEISIRGLFYCHFICSGGLIITIYCLEEGQDDWRVVRICNDDTTDVTFSVGNSNPAKLKFEIHSSISTETANIALYSYGVADETKYVPPTVRDYKIVDHTSKTSKIVRNVLEIDANNIKAMLHTSNEKYISFQLTHIGIDANMLPQGKIGYCSLFLTKSWDGLNDYEMVWIATASMGISISKDRNISDVEQFLQFVKEKDIKIFAKLATPTEESIPYVETDTSEVGLSWQDTTSPSPDIESKIYEVDEINIKLVNKNLFDYESKTKGYITNWNSVGNKISFTQTSNTDFATFVSYDVLTAGTNIIYKGIFKCYTKGNDSVYR